MNIERPRMKEINGENGNETIPNPSKLKIEELMDDLRCIIPDVLSLCMLYALDTIAYTQRCNFSHPLSSCFSLVGPLWS